MTLVIEGISIIGLAIVSVVIAAGVLIMISFASR